MMHAGFIVHCIAGIGNFALFCSCDLDLDPLTFIYELDLYPLKVYTQTKNELSISKLWKVIVLLQINYTYRHTDKEDLYTMRVTGTQDEVKGDRTRCDSLSPNAPKGPVGTTSSI